MAEASHSKPSFTPRRKWAVAFDVAVRTLVVVAVLVMLNHLAGVFFHRQYLSESTRVELSPRTQNVLQTLTNDVTVTIYYDRNDEFYPTIHSLLREYQALNPRLRVQTVDYVRDAAEALRIKQKHKLPETTRDEEKNFVIFESGSQFSQVIPGAVLTETVVEINEQERTYRRRATAFKGETVFTAVLRTIVSPKRYKAYVLQGHGEHNFDSGDELTGYLDFHALLRQNSVDPEPLLLSGTNAIPADCDLLIIAGPRAALLEGELEKIEQYLDEGGRLFALFNSNFIDPRAGLERILATQWGVAVSDGVVTDPANAINSIKAAPGQDVTVLSGAYADHPAVKPLMNFNLNLLAPRLVGELAQRENAADAPTVKELFFSAPTATLAGKPRVPAQSFPLAVAVEKRAVPGVVTGRGNSRMIIVGDSYFLANEPMKLLANRDFAYYALNWLMDRPQFTEGIGPKPFTEFRVVLTETQMTNLRWMLLGAIPGGILFFGVLVWWRRRK